VHRDSTLPTVAAGEPLCPHQRAETPAPHLMVKRGNWHHNKNPARGNIYNTNLSEEHYWSSRRKKNLKTPTTEAQEIKTIIKNNPRCINLNAE
jgi:hypothetical protein